MTLTSNQSVDNDILINNKNIKNIKLQNIRLSSMPFYDYNVTDICSGCLD